MRKHTRILLAALACVFLILGTTGCWNRRELDTLAILMGMGIDKPEDSGNVLLTAQIVKAGEIKTPKSGGSGGSGGIGGGGGGGGQKAYWNLESTGDTVFSALRGFTHESSRKVYLPHNQVLIFGQEIAREGLQKYIDFFVRDPETRLNVWVLVSKTRAGEIFDVKPEMENIPALDIADLIEAQKATSQTCIVRLRDFLGRLLSGTTAPIAPLVEVMGDGEDKTILISGTAVFKGDRLAGQLDKAETRGLLWAIGEVKSGIIEVDCPDGKASLEIIRASGKISPEVKDGRIYFKIEIKEEGNLGDQSCPEDLALPPGMEMLKREAAQAIKGEVMAALEKAREYNADIFGFGEAVHQKYPGQWKDLKSRWDEVFPHMEVEVDVEVKLDLTGQLSKPAVPEQE
jgi:spore germination protein KC